MNRISDNAPKTISQTMLPRLGIGSSIILLVLLSLLAATAATIYFGWTQGNGTAVPASGYVAMALGVIFSLAVGFGLMTLIFYSSRKGYDEPPVVIVSEKKLEAPSELGRTDNSHGSHEPFQISNAEETTW
jgi:hypothetical protein